MQAGVTLIHAKGKQYVKGTSSLGCIRAFDIKRREIVDCFADLQYGPALAIFQNGGVKVKITLVPHECQTVTPSGLVAYISGKQHQVVFSSQIVHPNADYVIELGGRLRLVSTLDARRDEVVQNV